MDLLQNNLFSDSNIGAKKPRVYSDLDSRNVASALRKAFGSSGLSEESGDLPSFSEYKE
jgi:hypothetical protein